MKKAPVSAKKEKVKEPVNPKPRPEKVKDPVNKRRSVDKGGGEPGVAKKRRSAENVVPVDVEIRDLGAAWETFAVGDGAAKEEVWLPPAGLADVHVEPMAGSNCDLYKITGFSCSLSLPGVLKVIDRSACDKEVEEIDDDDMSPQDKEIRMVAHDLEMRKEILREITAGTKASKGAHSPARETAVFCTFTYHSPDFKKQYLYLELEDGGSLDGPPDEDGVMTRASLNYLLGKSVRMTKLNMFASLVQSLQTLYRFGIWHRDLKPANLVKTIAVEKKAVKLPEGKAISFQTLVEKEYLRFSHDDGTKPVFRVTRKGEEELLLPCGGFVEIITADVHYQDDKGTRKTHTMDDVVLKCAKVKKVGEKVQIEWLLPAATQPLFNVKATVGAGIKVLDFGSSRTATQIPGAATGQMGTQGYRVKGKNDNFSDDCKAAGQILFEFFGSDADDITMMQKKFILATQKRMFERIEKPLWRILSMLINWVPKDKNAMEALTVEKAASEIGRRFDKDDGIPPQSRERVKSCVADMVMKMVENFKDERKGDVMMRIVTGLLAGRDIEDLMTAEGFCLLPLEDQTDKMNESVKAAIDLHDPRHEEHYKQQVQNLEKTLASTNSVPIASHTYHNLQASARSEDFVKTHMKTALKVGKDDKRASTDARASLGDAKAGNVGSGFPFNGKAVGLDFWRNSFETFASTGERDKQGKSHKDRLGQFRAYIYHEQIVNDAAKSKPALCDEPSVVSTNNLPTRSKVGCSELSN